MPQKMYTGQVSHCWYKKKSVMKNRLLYRKPKSTVLPSIVSFSGQKIKEINERSTMLNVNNKTKTVDCTYSET